MKISSRSDYALSCILRVADRYGEIKPVTIREVSGKEKLEPDYVEQLFVTMKRAGILKSLRGKEGGYVLAASPDKISAKDVIIAIEKSILKPVCSRKRGRRKKCIHFYNCNIKVLWSDLREDMELCLDRYDLQRLLKLRRKEKGW